MGFNESAMTFMPYGPRWRAHRKLFNDFINASMTKDHDPHQVKVVLNLLANLHQKPKDFRDHIHLFALPSLVVSTRLAYSALSRLNGSLALSISYGIEADSVDNEFLRLYTTMLEKVEIASVPGAFFVDIFPLRGSNQLDMERGGVN